jgi:fatty-acyl-CoA synthase
MADTLQQLLRERAEQDSVAVKCGDRSWTWREHIVDANAEAAALIAMAEPGRVLHVGVLLGNSPEMLIALAAAALGDTCCAASIRPVEGRRWRATSPRSSVSS